jgi:hypothetical protein
LVNLIDFDWPVLRFPVSNAAGPSVSVAVWGVCELFLKIIVEPAGTVTVGRLNLKLLAEISSMVITIVTGGLGVGVGVGLSGVGVGVGFLCGVGVGVTGVGVGEGVTVTVIAAGVAVGSFAAVCVRRDGTN